jgi:hypothetical protein
VFEEILARLAAALERHGIPAMVIGGQAVLLYGEPRLTRDIDVTLGVGTDRLASVLELLPEIPLKVLPGDVETFVCRTMVLPALHEATGVRVDLVFSFTPYEQEAIARARGIALGGRLVRFASPEDVIIHKVFAGRPRDLEDVATIVRNQPDLDRGYIRRWLEQFDAGLDQPVFLARFDAIAEQA